jgi:hypothetical protein
MHDLADVLYIEKIRAAQAMSPEEKLLAGPRLFDYACRITLSGIRHQHPELSEEAAHEILRRRLALARRLEHLRDER